MTSKEKVQHIIKLQKKLNKLTMTYSSYMNTFTDPESDEKISDLLQKYRDDILSIEEELYDYLPDD